MPSTNPSDLAARDYIWRAPSVVAREIYFPLTFSVPLILRACALSVAELRLNDTVEAVALFDGATVDVLRLAVRCVVLGDSC